MELYKYPFKENKRYWLEFSPILITSPEQFVPIYLAQQFQKEVIHNYWRSNRFEIDIDDDITQDMKNRTIDRKARMKDHLLQLLNIPCPKEYTFSIPYLKTGDYTYGELSSSNIVGLYSGVSNGCETSLHNAIIKFGLAIDKVNISSYSTLKTSLYNQTNIEYTSLNFRPCSITMIKAKHIPELRARLYLNLPMSFPLNSFKIINNEAGTELTRYIMNGLTSFISSQQPLIEYKSTDYMRALLFPPFPKRSSKEVVQAAIAKMELVE